MIHMCCISRVQSTGAQQGCTVVALLSNKANKYICRIVFPSWMRTPCSWFRIWLMSLLESKLVICRCSLCQSWGWISSWLPSVCASQESAKCGGDASILLGELHQILSSFLCFLLMRLEQKLQSHVVYRKDIIRTSCIRLSILKSCKQ